MTKALNKMGITAALIAVAVTAILAGFMPVSTAQADISSRIHYRCWDDTLRVSHGGWVSYRHMAERNCAQARNAYPNNVMWVESENY